MGTKKGKRPNRGKNERTEALNAQQEQFCREYAVDYNGTQAALRAGYSEKSAAVTACRLLKNHKVLARVRELQAAKWDRMVIDEKRVLIQLGRILIREEKESVVSSEETSNDYVDDKGKRRKETKKTPVVVQIPAKLTDVTRAAELIGRHLGMYQDKLDLTGDMDFSVKVDYGEMAQEPEGNRAGIT